MALMSSCFATAELTDKLAISGVVWQGASQEVHQAGFPAGAAWVPHLKAVVRICHVSMYLARPAAYKQHGKYVD